METAAVQNVLVQCSAELCVCRCIFRVQNITSAVEDTEYNKIMSNEDRRGSCAVKVLMQAVVADPCSCVLNTSDFLHSSNLSRLESCIVHCDTNAL
jgi:hypothetical protein